jgi:predicted transcriptional regulator
MTKSPKPTEGELAILQVLWQKGPSTVRQVHESLDAVRATGYTTTLKLMQIMAEKGLVARDQSSRTHTYTARLPQAQAQRQFVTDMIAKVFGGSSAKLVMHALSTHTASKEELAEIRQLIEDKKSDRKEEKQR